MGYILVTPPGSEPISRGEAKLHLRVDDINGAHPDDPLIDALVAASRQYAEQQTQRSLITQLWRYVTDCFPDEIKLIKGPISSIGTISYTDMAGATQAITWSAPVDGIQRSTDLTLIADLNGPLARITPAFGCTWPNTLPQIGSVVVPFTAGYGAASDVPIGIKQWMLLRIGAMYQNREEVGADLKPLPFIDSLLDRYRIEVA